MTKILNNIYKKKNKKNRTFLHRTYTPKTLLVYHIKTNTLQRKKYNNQPKKKSNLRHKGTSHAVCLDAIITETTIFSE